jgi:hypothetical protein
MLNDWLTNPGVLNVLGICSLVLLLAAIITYVWGQVRPSSSAAKPAVGRFSPVLAGVALIGTGLYMFFSNWVDENPKVSVTQLGGCELVFSAPAQIRTTSGIVIDATVGDENARSKTTAVPCTNVLRSVVLLIDGQFARDEFPIVLEAQKTIHRWFPAALAAGKHRIDVISRSLLGSYTAAAFVTDTDMQFIGKKDGYAIAGCTTHLLYPGGRSTVGQSVSIDIKVTCGKPKDVAPMLFVNGSPSKPLAANDDSNGTQAFRWIFTRTKNPDRLDAVVVDVADDWTTAIIARQPVTLNNLKESLSAITGVIVGLGGLLVTVTQFVRGQSATV